MNLGREDSRSSFSPFSQPYRTVTPERAAELQRRAERHGPPAVVRSGLSYHILLRFAGGERRSLCLENELAKPKSNTARGSQGHSTLTRKEEGTEPFRAEPALGVETIRRAARPSPAAHACPYT